MNQLKNLFLLIISVGFLNSCYSFSGSSLTDEKTVQINEFPNNSALVNPTLAQQFSTDIQNRFLQRTTLKGTKQNPDILIEGEITDYSITPTTISSTTQQTSAGGTIQESQNKLTITVKVRYENKLHPELNFEKNFSDEAVFNSSLSQDQIETSQVKIATDRIINKIFNDIVANW
ncbi:LPS assembly lipoprotein LptE [Chryseobacterium sp. Ch-15]|uniref:LPS assembly lipoprotein LptE n=1 Tax=Chryseobacterium muglaense TaxID=2893752 RepID=A0A9Q3UY01_9FLAO|nr:MULTISPECIES: LPS assembly lipoprotein LptE [Chryseobacterium]MBD3905960.1 LptE family protein [Chryseobacterium muglaense]MBO6185285.1 LptE family protein [Chryseobacterium sp.]MCC9035045.1 LPS assembly lipoprotein LptE [Chryseobacterium muglaense]MCM2555758.1 LPS assembly lipoprotein LptE [Chryseobacterium muglaense]